MKYSVKILLLIVLSSGVINSLPIQEDDNVTDEPHTKILDSVPDGSLEEQPKPCTEVSKNLKNEEEGNMKQKYMLKLPAKFYVSNQYANEYVVIMPQSAMEYLTAFNRNIYQKSYATLPSMDTLPSVYATRPRIANYYENSEPYYPELLKQKTVLVPIHLTPERTTSEEDFWAQLTQDSMMNNIIPTMEVPLPRDPYGQYEQLVRSTYPFSAQELISNGVLGYYPESELRAYDRPLLYKYKPEVSSERDISEDYPHTEIHTGQGNVSARRGDGHQPAVHHPSPDNHHK